jgi:3-dehydrosphinganine reductase
MSHTIITGGSSGIGLALARALVKDGGSVTVISRSASKLAAAESELTPLLHTGQQVLALAADVADAAAIESAVEAAIARLGAPDLLITSAGIGADGRFDALSIADHQEAMQINYFGSLYAARAVLPSMRLRRSGTICFISSGAGLIGIFGYSAYTPTKFALRGLAQVLRSELAGDGVRISIAHPPDTDTPMYHEELKRAMPETRAVAGTVKPWTADAVAAVILRGIRKGRFEIPIGLELRLIQYFYGLFEPLIHRYMDHLVAKARRR